MRTVQKLLIIGLLAAAHFSCEGQVAQKPADTQDYRANLVDMARKFMTSYEVSDWFIPPESEVVGGGDGTMMNYDAASWAVRPKNGPNGENETVISFSSKILHASLNNPTEWSEYSCNGQTTGFCGYPQGGIPSEWDYIAGVICYSLVNVAARQAGYTCVNKDSELSTYAGFPQVSGSEIKAGDVVLYDFEDDDVYEHIGVISSTAGAVQDYLVISSVGIVEQFNYGVAEKRLEVFGTPPRGDFQSWNPDWEDYVWIVVRLPEPQ